MIITRTPLRVSFIGGGSDLPWFFREFGGSVISTSINKYVYVSVHKLFEDEKIYLKYSKSELVDKPHKLKHPIVKAILTEQNLSGIEINVSSDVSGGSGLGSSSSFTVGTLHSLHLYLEEKIDKKRLAEEACRIEIDVLKESIGVQDQYAASFGGINHMEFLKNGEVKIKQINLSKEGTEWLTSCMYLLRFRTGQRSASQILEKQRKNAMTSSRAIDTLKELSELSRKVAKVIEEKPYELGKALKLSWELKKQSNPYGGFQQAEEIISLGLRFGAVGAKVLGAGGSGFILFLLEKGANKYFEKNLENFKLYRVKPENFGSTLIYADRRSQNGEF